jgi:hypothetical protein
MDAGFVPSKNMEDDVVLFENESEAIKWLQSTFRPLLGSDVDAKACADAAVRAAEAEQVSMEAEERCVHVCVC